MNRKTFLLSAFLFFLFFTSFSQTEKRYVYYFDKDFGITDKSGSVFTGHGALKDGLLNLTVYSNNLPDVALLVANFTDTSLAVNQGLFQSFYFDGKKESECNYENNQLSGSYRKWDKNLHLIDSFVYDHGKMVDSARFFYFNQGKLSYNLTHFKNNQFEQHDYNDSGSLVFEFFFTGNKGIRKEYNAGTIKIDSLFTREEKDASFPGGARAWQTYITKEIASGIDAFTDKDYGTCVVRFIIDTNGNVSDVEATTMKGTALADLAVNAVKNGPKWIPAVQYGRTVRAYRLQPVMITRPIIK
jgi:hypothetical protein